MNKFTNDIKINGIKEPIKYVSYQNDKYVVDGHHRLYAAKTLRYKNVPAVEVQLPGGDKGTVLLSPFFIDIIHLLCYSKLG